MKKLKVVSLFSGCGGFDKGLLGGFEYLNKFYSPNMVEIVHASDIDKFCVKTYNENFKNKSILQDITNLSFKKIKADIVIGGFPCQQFSSVNPTKDPNSTKAKLFFQMARVIDEVKPTLFLAENVKGFFTLNKGKHFKQALRSFEKLGYTTYFQLMNTANFGIPQKRERIIIVGVKKNIPNIFNFPIITHDDLSEDKEKYIPLRAVVKDLTSVDKKFYFSERAVLGAKNAKNNMKRLLAQKLDAPCLTITSHLSKVSINSRDPVLLIDSKKEIYRRFTPFEAAQIQSFPENFIFPVSDTQKYKQIGNAVPPVLAWHLTRSLIKFLQNRTKRKHTLKSEHKVKPINF